MSEEIRRLDDVKAKDAYTPPDLVVHGSIDTVTQGTAQGVPDAAAPGSTLPPP